MNSVNKPSNVIRFNKITHQIESPTLLLETRSGKYIGQINYTDLKLCFVGNGLDEISFNVHKTVNGIECPFWDRLQGLSIINFKEYGRFEANFSTTDEAETTKACVAVSLETELGQRILRNFHVNDEDATGSVDNFKSTILYDDKDPEHSLLHRVLSDKAPHWSIGEVSDYFNVGGKVWSPNTFQRTYTVDGTSIYDFLVSEVSEETKCVFTFDTYNRKINCYNLEDCVYNNSTLAVMEGAYKSNGLLYDANGNELNTTEYSYCEGIGNDTNIFITKNRLAQNFQIETDKDNIKNCFYVTGGDDTINNLGVPAANATGNNYIYLFDNFQYEDMSEQLRTKLKTYNNLLSDKQKEFYKVNGLFLRYCSLQDNYHYLVHSMFPDTTLKTTTAKEQMNEIKNHFNNHSVYIKYSCSATSFTHVTGNVESMLNVLCDSRYNVKMLSGTDYPMSCTVINKDTATGTWKGYVKITRETDEKDTIIGEISVRITLARDKDGLEYSDENIAYVNQKMQIAIARMSIADLDFSNMNDTQMKSLFEQYNLTSLNSFVEAFENCLVTLKNQYDNLGMTNETVTSSYTTAYNTWLNRKAICKEIQEIRQKQVDDISGDLISIQKEITAFNESLNLQAYLNNDTLWKEFCSYVREDEYNNPNYTSDNLSDGKILQNAKELLDAATNELKKACVLQKTISGNMYNLFAVDELESLYDSFALYNYIRCKADDKIYKLRLIQIDFDENSPEIINVTFSEQIESVDGKISDLQNIISQASSIATSYSSTVNQAKQGLSAANTFTALKNEGFTSAEYVIKNSIDEEIVIDSTGLNARSMNDVGVYGEHQLRLTGNGMYLTNKAWKDVSMAVGLGKFKGDWRYGVWANCIVGNFIVGEDLEISDKNGYVRITGDGVKIGGGSLYIANDDYSVEIDPNQQGDKTAKGYLFCIKKKSDNSDIMSVDMNGDGYFKGKIIATSGEFSGNISSTAIISGGTFLTKELNESVGVDMITEISKGLFKNSGFNNGRNRTCTISSGCISLRDTTYKETNSGAFIDSNNFWLNNIFSATDTYISLSKPCTFYSTAKFNNGLSCPNGGFTVSGHDVVKTLTDHQVYLYWDDSNLQSHVNDTYTGKVLTLVDGNNIDTVSWMTSSWTANGNFRTGSIYVDHNLASVAWVKTKVDTSDERVKIDFQSLPSNIDGIFDSLKPQQYRFNHILEKEGYYFGDTAQHIEKIFEDYGLDIEDYNIVQKREVNEFNGEANYINPEHDKYHYINQDNIIWLCVDQIQKLKKELKNQKDKI